MPNSPPITVAHGDGIGPGLMEATLHILKEAGARLDIETIAIGEKVYLQGNSAGINKSAWKSLRRTNVFLKAPITTPQGGGFNSLNVTTDKFPDTLTSDALCNFDGKAGFSLGQGQ